MLLAGVMAAGAGVVTWRVTSRDAAPPYQAATVTRQTITKSISATGTLQALTTVQVGTQASGTIAELYADFNTQVKKGQVIARLDTSQFQAQLAQANAALSNAQAGVQSAQANVLSAEGAVQAAQANVERTDAAVTNAQRTYDRTKQLVDYKVAAAMDLQNAEAALNEAAAEKQQAIAQLTQSRSQAQATRSQVGQAQAQAAQAKAAVDLAQVNLQHTVIEAPIDGVVVARNVDVGQTVAASLQAPVLFLIANDLTRMQVLANIDEADVGQLAPGSDVSFTVDAYPSDVFRGKVSQVRLAPQTVQNVVTYTAVIDVRNEDLKLKPGMTANVTVITGRRENVLTIPNSALRFRPATGDGSQGQSGRKQGQGGRPVWKIEGERLTPVRVELGMTDGVTTEVASGNLAEGDRVATPPPTAEGSKQAPARSPFQMGGGGRRGYGR
jgi:HlyD family secretion protein